MIEFALGFVTGLFSLVILIAILIRGVLNERTKKYSKMS